MPAQLLPHPLHHHRPDLNLVPQLVEATVPRRATGEVPANPKQLEVTVPLLVAMLSVPQGEMAVARTPTKPLLAAPEEEQAPGVVLPLPQLIPTLVPQDKQGDQPLLQLDMEHLLQDPLVLHQVDSSRQQHLDMEHLPLAPDPALALLRIQATEHLVAATNFQAMENNPWLFSDLMYPF